MSNPWLKGLLVGGAVLAIALLVQTVVNYQYVSDSLISQDARRVADERVRNVERGARLAGDFLVLFSDGITEAPNRRGDQFGEDRLTAAIQSAVDGPSQVMCDAVLGAVHEFTEGRTNPDDQTLVVVRLPGGKAVPLETGG